ncbi:MAG: acyl carrier protein [Bacillota bacterium]
MEEIKAMLTELRPEFNFDESDNFIADGYLDSFDIITMISTIEEKYGVVVDGLDILPENFMSYEAICNLIKKSGGNI